MRTNPWSYSKSQYRRHFNWNVGQRLTDNNSKNTVQSWDKASLHLGYATCIRAETWQKETPHTKVDATRSNLTHLGVSWPWFPTHLTEHKDQSLNVGTHYTDKKPSVASSLGTGQPTINNNLFKSQITDCCRGAPDIETNNQVPLQQRRGTVGSNFLQL